MSTHCSLQRSTQAIELPPASKRKRTCKDTRLCDGQAATHELTIASIVAIPTIPHGFGTCPQPGVTVGPSRAMASKGVPSHSFFAGAFCGQSLTKCAPPHLKHLIFFCFFDAGSTGAGGGGTSWNFLLSCWPPSFPPPDAPVEAVLACNNSTKERRDDVTSTSSAHLSLSSAHNPFALAEQCVILLLRPLQAILLELRLPDYTLNVERIPKLAAPIFPLMPDQRGIQRRREDTSRTVGTCLQA